MIDAVTWYKQSALRWNGSQVVYIDPWDVPASDPKADVIFITHAHFDHFQPEQITALSTQETVILAPTDCAEQLSGNVRGIKPGESGEVNGIAYSTIPSYNIAPERLELHPRDNNWLGWILAIGSSTAYLAGDTDHVPEMNDVKADVAFVPIGGTYTMDVDEAAGAVKQMSPGLAVPCHFGFVVGASSLGAEFVKKIAPVPGRVLEPVHKFEQ